MQYNDLLNDVILDAPGAPVPVALRAIREAVRLFCKESMAYRMALPVTSLTYSSGIYTIKTPAGAQIESVISPMMFISHKDIQGASPEWLDMNVSGWRTDTADHAKFFSMKSNNTFVLTPDNGVDRSAYLQLSLVLMPDRTSTTIDDDFGNRWFDGLVAGTKYLLLITPNTEWFNPELAKYYKSKFDDYVIEAKRYVRTGLRHPQADGLHHVKLHY